MSTIPVSAVVQVIPSVVGAGGAGLALSGLVLTSNTRIPVGTVLSFPTQASVSSYFGGSSVEATIAADYFSGFVGATAVPGAMLLAQYNQSSVAPWLRGASVAALTLAQLQALSGTLVVVVNGVQKTSSTINLSTATSFSSAAALIATGFAAYDAVTASSSTIAAGTATNATLASITGNILTVAGVVTGAFVVGGVLSGAGVTAGTTILSQLTGTTGGAGTYLISAIQNVAASTITQTYGLLTVVSVASGALAVGQVISGGTIAAGTTITALGTGTGAAGTYVTSGGAQTVAATTVSAGLLACTYDSVSGGFIITGGTPGVTGTIGFATGTLSASLNLIAANGAILSQGAAATTPGLMMASVVAQTTNWATFMTAFDPDNGYGSTNKQLFAAWNTQQANLYAYVVWDTDPNPALNFTSTTSLGYILKNNGNSGAIVLSAHDYNIAAFVCGLVASINFNAKNGRATLAYKQQSGLTPSVTNQTAFANLINNGYNFYGSYATASQGFNWLFPGSVSGLFQWADSYVNQIWMNSGFQLALVQLMLNTKSIPYNNAGYSLIRAACMAPINAGLNFGAINPGVVLSPAQIAEVNTAAGIAIDAALFSQGWYLQILPATAQVRGNRTSPPMNFWYMDGGSVQSISLASIEIQ
jgi:hypothetical protein